MDNTILHIDCDKSGIRWTAHCGAYDVSYGRRDSIDGHTFVTKYVMYKAAYRDARFCEECVQRVKFLETAALLGTL